MSLLLLMVVSLLFFKCVCLLFSLLFSPPYGLQTSSIHLFPKTLRSFICDRLICVCSFHPFNTHQGLPNRPQSDTRGRRGRRRKDWIIFQNKSYDLKPLCPPSWLPSPTKLHLHPLWYPLTIKLELAFCPHISFAQLMPASLPDAQTHNSQTTCP